MSERRFPLQLIPWLLLAAAFGFAYLTRGILLPFVFGFAVAYLLDPLADKLEARGLGRGLATGLILSIFFLGIVGGLIALWPLLQAQLLGLLEALPGVIAAVREYASGFTAAIADSLGRDFGRQAEDAVASSMRAALDGIGAMFTGLFSSGLALLGVLSLILISPVVAFYLVRDYDRIVAHVSTLIPPAQKPAIGAAMREIDAVLSGFVRGQLTIMAAIGAVYAAGYTLIGLDYGLILGVLGGLLSFIPFIGMLANAALGLAVGYAQWGADWHLLAIVGVWLFVQILESTVLTPRLMSHHVNLHPVWVLFAVFAGSEVAGLVGVMVAVPAAAVIAVLVRQSLGHYHQGMERTAPGTVTDRAETPP